MKVLLLAVASSLLVCRAWGGMSQIEFNEKIDDECFPSKESPDPHFVHGQINPRSQTLENFIAKAEKLEAANPNIRLKEELYHFIRNYIYERIEFNNIGEVIRYIPAGQDSYRVDDLWEPDESERTKKESIQVPFSQEERCGLFFLLSHSIIRNASSDEVFKSATNDTVYLRRVPSRDVPYTKNASLFPMEIGVVSVEGLREAVALGKVLTGMYVGLRSDRKLNVLSVRDNIKIESEGLDPTMDTLYALTIADVISLAKWRGEFRQREGYADDGTWLSVILESEIDNKDVCPMIYKLNDVKSLESYSSLRGAADGFILGKVVQDIVLKNSDVKLSEILRMYYSKGGLLAKTEESSNLWASFCNREANIDAYKDTIMNQLKLYNILTLQTHKALDDSVNVAWNYFLSAKSKGFGLWTQEQRNLCNNDLSMEKPENLPLESPLDITAVIDTSYGIEFVKRQQEILGYVAKKLKLSYYGSRMTVLWDKKLTPGESAKTGRVILKPLIENTYSSACAACLVTEVLQDDKYETAPEDEVILAIDQLLQEKKDNETKQTGAKGKVVIYFNFKEDVKSSRVDPAEVRENKALRDMLVRHVDVAVFALGRANDLIKKYARNSAFFILSAVDDAPDKVGQDLMDRISKSPASLQYPDCERGTSESSAIYEDYVSRNGLQHWQMPARYLYKSRSLKFTFESMFGSVKVCYNRATVATELVDKNCKSGTKIVFDDSNPCKGFDEISCSPFFFSVMGINNTEEANAVCTDSNTENKCKTMDQIRFRVSHEGVRCSGSSALLSFPSLLVLGVILLKVLSKLH